MIVREEVPGDAGAVDEIHRLAFGQPDEAEIVRRLRTSDAFIPELSLVAEEEREPIGHILFTRVTVDPPGDARMVSLAPMAVLPEHQRRGVGSALVRRGLEAAAGRGEGVVIVVGHPSYYPRFGFVPASGFGLTCPFPVPDDAFLALPLRGGISVPSGLVVYPSELGGA